MPDKAALQPSNVHKSITLFSEGITTDGKDGLYVSLFVLDQIWHVNPATGEKKKVADVPGGDLKGDLIGIERDPTDGTILAAFKRATKVNLFTADHPDCRDTTDAATGIYRVNPQTGAVSPFVTRGTGVSLCFPDDIAIDPSGNVYVSDLELGVIWKFDRAGHGGVWSDDPLLGWTEQLPNDLALNGPIARAYLSTKRRIPTAYRPPVARVPFYHFALREPGART